MTVADEICALGREVHDAWAVSDVARLSGLLADEYTHVDIYGRVYDRATWLAFAAEPRSVGTLTVDDEAATVIDDTAVLTSRLSIPGLGEASLVRLLQVWVRRPDGWKRRWYQATSVSSVL